MVSMKLFNGLREHLDTSDSEPYCPYEPRFIYLELVECEHEDSSTRYEERLPDAGMHSTKIYITSIVDFFHKKKSHTQKTTDPKKESTPHQCECKWGIIQWIHIHIEDPDRSTTGDENNKKYGEIDSNWHKYLTKNQNRCRLLWYEFYSIYQEYHEETN
jgi:hypothetical protein